MRERLGDHAQAQLLRGEEARLRAQVSEEQYAAARRNAPPWADSGRRLVGVWSRRATIAVLALAAPARAAAPLPAAAVQRPRGGGAGHGRVLGRADHVPGVPDQRQQHRRYGTTNVWDKLTDGSWVSDAFVYTGTNTIGPNC